jgi:hypothetical protein
MIDTQKMDLDTMHTKYRKLFEEASATLAKYHLSQREREKACDTFFEKVEKLHPVTTTDNLITEAQRFVNLVVLCDRDTDKILKLCKQFVSDLEKFKEVYNEERGR